MAIVLLLFGPLPIFLDLHDQRLKSIGKELPREDLALVKGGEQLVQTLQNGRSVHGHHVKLAVKAPQQCLDCLVMNCAKVNSCALGHLVIKIVRLK